MAKHIVFCKGGTHAQNILDSKKYPWKMKKLRPDIFDNKRSLLYCITDDGDIIINDDPEGWVIRP